MPRNRLAEETSPYLLQHADNPVDWRAWGPEALAAARAENKPVLLSVGYAACHWCHVMAHESFENPEIADLMNRLFVPVKVDREERPDIDTIYQSALAMLGQQGGWPLTMFLTPEGEPFWGGTYFPPESRWGRPGFPDVLRAISDTWAREPDKVGQNVAALRDGLAKTAENRGGGPFDLALLDRVAEQLSQQFDPVWGGIRGAPKFPQPGMLELMWRAWLRSGHAGSRDAVLRTLTAMSQGGIWDHLGGGFARYSTDAEWLAPHFEKMLYDNAQLIEVLTLVWQATRDPLYAQRVAETVEWLEREMLAEGAEGAFAATLDADSEGEEGRFYVWTEAEIDRVLGAGGKLLKRTYDVTAGGNWEGQTILNRRRDPALLEAESEAKLAGQRRLLLAARASRVRPGWDDKVLADWNGMMIAALANAGLAFDRPEWIELATRAFAFVSARMVSDDRLHHSWRHGVLKHAATLDDYAAMSRGGLALHEATGEAAFLDRVRDWVAVLDRHYWDTARGGYFLTADDAEALIVRTKTAHDSAVPAGNGLMVGVLARLWHLTGEEPFRTRAEALVAAFAGELDRSAFALPSYLNGAELLERALQVVIVGQRDAPDTRALLRAVLDRSLPDRVLSIRPPDASPLPPSHPASGKGQVDGRATAYLCVGQACRAPVTEAAALVAMLDEPR